MVLKRNKSMITRSTPVKSTASKPTPTKSTPLKRKQDVVGNTSKKFKSDLSFLEEEFIKSYLNQVPAITLSMGNGDTGQLGLGEEILEKKYPAVIPDLNDIVKVCAGGMHSVCLSKSGKVYSFGCNDEGALGRSIIEDEETMVPGIVEFDAEIVVTDITAGDSHSSVLTNDGKVYIWGSFRDNNGVIGLLKPFEKVLKPTLVQLDRKIVKVCSGENHMAMLNDKGEILTFGCAEQGQLGRVSPNHLVRGGRGGMAPLLIPAEVRVKNNVKFCDMWTGAYCTVGKSLDGDIYGCGLNNYKQLGLDEELVQLMMTNLVKFNKLGESWKSFVFGQHHSMALTTSSKVFVVGRGEYGNLGQGNNDHLTDVTQVRLPSDDIHSIAACNRTSYALMNDGTAYSWGMGSSYQLGHGSDEDVNLPTKIMGKQISDKKIIEISPGFQHVLLRVIPKTANEFSELSQSLAVSSDEKKDSSNSTTNLNGSDQQNMELEDTEKEVKFVPMDVISEQNEVESVEKTVQSVEPMVIDKTDSIEEKATEESNTLEPGSPNNAQTKVNQEENTDAEIVYENKEEHSDSNNNNCFDQLESSKSHES